MSDIRVLMSVGSMACNAALPACVLCLLKPLDSGICIGHMGVACSIGKACLLDTIVKVKLIKLMMHGGHATAPST